MNLNWIKACSNGACIEVALLDHDIDVYAIRTAASKEAGASPVLATKAEWDAFVAAVKDGRFDQVTP